MRPATRPRRRLLAVGAGLIAVSAYAGAVGLATRIDPHLRHLTDRLPLRSPVFGGVALAAVVAVPHTVLARHAWRGDDRTDAAATVAGGLLIGWITAEAAILREPSMLESIYLGIGLLTILAGRDFLHRPHQPHQAPS